MAQLVKMWLHVVVVHLPWHQALILALRSFTIVFIRNDFAVREQYYTLRYSNAH
jgi:hypothetical protein